MNKSTQSGQYNTQAKKTSSVYKLQKLWRELHYVKNEFHRYLLMLSNSGMSASKMSTYINDVRIEKLGERRIQQIIKKLREEVKQS